MINLGYLKSISCWNVNPKAEEIFGFNFSCQLEQHEKSKKTSRLIIKLVLDTVSVCVCVIRKSEINRNKIRIWKWIS